MILAVIMSLPLGVFAYTEPISNAQQAMAEAPILPSLTNTASTAYFSFSGNNANNGTSASSMKRSIDAAWDLLPNGGTLVIPAKGYITEDITLPAATSPIVITAKDKNGTMYYEGPGTEETTQLGMIMPVAGKTVTFTSDVIFRDMAILQRDSQSSATASTYAVTNGATMVIEESTDFLHSKTVNPAKVNSKIRVDAGAVAIIKSPGALSYHGEGAIYVDKSLIGNGITADLFVNFTGKLYDLEGNPLCSVTDHTYSVTIQNRTYYNVCLYCGYSEVFTYNEPEVVSDDQYYWAYDGSDSNDGSTLSAPVSSATKIVSTVNNGGTVCVPGKGHAGASIIMDFGGTTMLTAIGPDGTDYRGTDFRGQTQEQYGAIMWQSSSLATQTYIDDIIFKDINIYNRNRFANILAITNKSTALFENVELRTSNADYPSNALYIETGSTVIMKGSNVGSFSQITGNGTLICDIQLIKNGKLTLSQLKSFDGVVMTTDCKDLGACMGGDIDGNGVLNNQDITLLIRHLSGWKNSEIRIFADMNSDGKVNNRDAVELIFNYANHIPDYTQNNDYLINSFYDLNQNSHEVLSHENEQGYASLELDYRSFTSLGYDNLQSTTVFYPRVKKMANGRYILFFQNKQTGNSIYYITSDDLESWSAPQFLFEYKSDGDVKYASCDAIVLDNGDILAFCSYRTLNDYANNPDKNGIVMKRSRDNGLTWSNEERVYVGTNWEPYALQLASGEIQVYYTNTYCYYDVADISDASTGTAMIRSFDRGYTWTSDLSTPYSGQIVSQTATRIAGDFQLYSDQMPSAIEMLGTGKIMLALETRLNKEHEYRITLSYSSDNWSTPLSNTEAGPSEKITNAWTGAGPSLRQFTSGEIVCSYARQGVFAYRMISPDGKSYLEIDTKPFKGLATAFWGNMEMIGTHTVLGISETRDRATESGTQSTIDYGRLNLNHSITAKNITPEIDGDAADWEGIDEAFFIGSVSQAQASIRSGFDADNVYFLAERLDNYLSCSGDTVTLCFSDSKVSNTYYRLVVGVYGIVSFDYYDGTGYSSLTSDIEGKVIINGTVDDDSDTDTGYSAEIKIPYSVIGGESSELYVFLTLDNSDKGTKYTANTLANSSISDKSTWLIIKY